ncbi:MAG: 50S ribosomal protein L18 [Candidatus Cloacimonetes bacterium]|nr:50S ribosomal protein L18 [Candidatus Cloacimonadota bacterium]
MVKKNNVIRREKRARRVLAIRKKLYGTTERPRLAVYRSLNNIYAQIIDDTTGKTLVSMSTIAKDFQMEKAKKVETSFQVGVKLGEKAIAAGITKVSFDRSGYKYHGRVKALADGARKAGLEF